MSLALRRGMRVARLFSTVFTIGLAGLVAGCHSADAPKKTDAQSQRRILNEGASILYSHISDLSKFHLIFIVKSESEAVNAVTTEVTDYATSLMKTLEKVVKDYPAVSITLDPVPVMQQRTESALTKDRLLKFAPIVGLTDESFDRRMLQSEEGVLNQLRFMAQALADEEPDPGLKEIWTTAHTRFEALYQKVLGLLQDKYYVNAGERKVKK